MAFATVSSSRFRVLASGTTSIPAATTVTLATVTVSGSEVVKPMGFIATPTAGVTLSEADPSIFSVAGTEGVLMWLEATANADEAAFRARNVNATTARTLRWALLAFMA